MSKRLVQFTETVMRDANQSLMATRMPYADFAEILPTMDKAGYYSVECWALPDMVLKGFTSPTLRTVFSKFFSLESGTIRQFLLMNAAVVEKSIPDLSSICIQLRTKLLMIFFSLYNGFRILSLSKAANSKSFDNSLQLINWS